MLDKDGLHQALIQALLGPPPVASLRLISRFESDIIRNPDHRTLYVFLPDTHLVSDRMRQHYSYHFNSPGTFYEMLTRLNRLRDDLLRQGNAFEAIQLGDLYDLWREGTTEPTPIIEDYRNITTMLYRHAQGLQARLLVGNHDPEMLGTPQFSLSLFLPTYDAPFCFVTHGHWFDPVERLPDWLQQAAILFAGRAPQPQEYPLAEIKARVGERAQASDGFRDGIQQTEPAPLEGLIRIGAADQGLPTPYQVAFKSEGHQMHPFMDAIGEMLQRYRPTHPGWDNIRLVVIGHTHHARVSVNDVSDPGRPTVLVDCGAWIEKYKDADRTARPNCQIGAMTGNDIRIYQLDPLG